jgi:uncharacterized protein GlcG (DUF336 family)
MLKKYSPAIAAAIALALQALSAYAATDVIKVRIMGSDLAADVTRGAVHACRAKGYQVSAVVLDRAGDVIAAQRDTLAARHTLEIAERKAGTVVLAGVDSVQMVQNRQDIRPELNQMQGIIIMGGGVQIRAAGSLIGAVGVSGAPGGDIDEECAKAGLEKVADRLDFAD